MAKTTLNAPEGITYPAGRLEFACEADTVGEALQQLVAKEPRLKPRTATARWPSATTRSFRRTSSAR